LDPESSPGVRSSGHFFVCAFAPTFAPKFIKIMTIPQLVALVLFVLLSNPIHAQMERTMYQVFEIDSAQVIDFEVKGEYEVIPWAGNSILVETNIQIWDASKEILAHLIKEGRYDLATDSTTGPNSREIRIFTKNTERKPIKRLDGQKCLEIPVTRIFVPDTFIIPNDKKRLTRKSE